MFPQTGGVLCITLFLLSAALLINELSAEGRVVCYYTNWSVYRPGTAKFNPQNINPYLCTHLIYAFGGFTKDNQMKPFDKYQDIEQSGYAKFTGLKTYNKQLKTMIAIGGWNEASSRFSPLVASPERRQKFVKNILKFLRQNHFDGIDLDWEYPAHREGGKPRDRDNYARFVQELRAEFERESEKTGRTRLLVTMAVPAGIQYIEKGYDIPKLNKYLDWFNVLTYDFHSAHEPSVNHHAPLYSLEEESEYNYDAELNIDYSIKYYIGAGADRDKLVLGIPTYGRSFTLINEESTEIGAPSEGPGEQGDATREKGYLAYYEICQSIKEDPEWTVVEPNPNAMGPYAYRRNQWVGYDDEAIVRKKSQYVVDNGLGGIMFWSIDNDDFRGICSGRPYPLIEAAKEAMLDALGIGINEVSKSTLPQKPNRPRNRDSTLSTRNRLISNDEKVPRKRAQTTTTSAPSSTTIKLTEVEGSSLYIGGRTTPPPPTTPDPGTDFKCEEEGFFQHPRDCKKYYWCLDSGPSGLGIVAHQFTCPSGLYFNPSADSCDFARNVPCNVKKSTTAAPVTKSSPVTTTLKSTQNRITAATSRISYLRTTPRITTTTKTTTTTEPTLESQEDEEEIEDNFERNQPQRESEEDPKVIKELIDLIKRVGGIEELEKHLLRKDDGTISIKQHNSVSADPTTPSSISKSLYDKVLSRPNAYNSFRNRFTNSNTLRQSSRTSNENIKHETSSIEDTDGDDSKTTSSYSKYSSVVRGNSRQGPQNEGIERLAEFDGFLKERKQYVTINRNRDVQKSSKTEVDADNDEDNGYENENVNDRKIFLKDDESLEEFTETKNYKSLPLTTPSYVNIRRTRPFTTLTSTTTTNVGHNTQGNKYYTTLSRSHNKIPDIEPTDTTAEVTLASSTRYKYLDRTRPVTPTTESTKVVFRKLNDEESDIRHKKDDFQDAENIENLSDYNHPNTVQLKAAKIGSTRTSQQLLPQQQQEQSTTTSRTYANIGRRTTTTTTEPTQTVINTTAEPIFTRIITTQFPILKSAPNIFENLSPKPITTTTTTTFANITLPIIITTNPELISSAVNTATTKSITTSVATTTPLSITNHTIEETEIPILKDTSKKLKSSDPYLFTSNSLKSDPALVSSILQSNLDTIKQNADILENPTKQPRISNIINQHHKLNKNKDIDNDNEDEDEDNDEIKLVINNINRSKYSTINRTATTDNITISNDKRKTLTSQNNITDRLDIYNITTTIPKYSAGRIQSNAQELLNHSSLKQTTTKSTRSKTITTTTTTPTAYANTQSINNEFLGSVSSPRPFGYPKRRGRPTVFSTTPSATDATPVKTQTEDRLSFTQKTHLNDAVNSQTKLRTPSTAALNSLTISRRPVLSVRKRLMNTTTDTTIIKQADNVTLYNNYNHNYNKNNNNSNNSNNNNNNNNTNNNELQAFTTTTATTMASLTSSSLLDEFLTAPIPTPTPTLTKTTATTTATTTTTAESTAVSAAAAVSTTKLANNFSKYNRLRLIRPLDGTNFPSKQYLNNLNHHRANTSLTDLTLASSSLTTSSLNDVIGQTNKQNTNNNYNGNKTYRRHQSSSFSSSSLLSTPTTLSSTSSASSSTALRRKYQARRPTTTVTPTSNIDDTEAPRTVNPLFKRRPNSFKIPRSTTTPRTVKLSEIPIAVNDDNPHNESKNHIIFEIAEATDQIAKSSINTNHFNHLNDPSSPALSSVSIIIATTTVPTITRNHSLNIEKTVEHEEDKAHDDDDDDDDDGDNDNNNDDNHNDKSSVTIIIRPTPKVGKVAIKQQQTTNINELAASSATLGAKNQSKFTTKKRKTITARRPQSQQNQRQQQQQQQQQYDELHKPVNGRMAEVRKKINYGHNQINENRQRPYKYQALNVSNNNNNNKKIQTTTKVSTLEITNHSEHDYDYYDDEDVRVVGNKDQQLKVILHGGGIIECLDQGNFPHPLSCRKFISCAKFETGGVVGWEYTCPKGLSYDPVGGMCNWAAGLGCKE